MARAPGALWHPYAEHFGEGGVAGERAWVYPSFHSTEIGNERPVVVWLPPSYPESERRYPVLYLNDGQNVLDARTSFAGEWGVDETIEEAPTEQEAIVVAIWNRGEERVAEYSPWDTERAGRGRGANYLRFLSERVKPEIDRAFRTLPHPAANTLGGSSMGALISLVGAMRHPESFGSALVMSPALWWADGAIFHEVAERGGPEGRVYLDVGSLEGEETLRNAERLARFLELSPQTELRYWVEEGGRHEEAAWRRRFPRALEFLVPRRQEREERTGSTVARRR